MKERPILMNGEMVRATLEGRKTQTRRIVKIEASGRVKAPRSSRNWHVNDPDVVLACPYGQPGTHLWVRETWAWWPADRSDKREDGLIFRADDDDLECRMFQWRPSIHMPRWASRITLEITGVRVERLQEISDADAISEGIDRVGGPTSICPWRNYRIGAKGEMSLHCSAPTRSYMTLWESINGPGSWDLNPWVWVIEFKRIT